MKRVSELEPPPLLWGAVETPDPAASSGETRQASAASPRCGLPRGGVRALGVGSCATSAGVLCRENPSGRARLTRTQVSSFPKLAGVFT